MGDYNCHNSPYSPYFELPLRHIYLACSSVNSSFGCSILFLVLNWLYMSKGTFLTSLVQSIQSIYWSIYSIYSLIHSIDLFNLFNLMSLVQSIDLSIVFYRFNLFTNPLALARLIHLSIYYTLLIQSIYLSIVHCLSHLSIALILFLVAIKLSSWSSVACHLVSSSSVKPEYNHPIFLLGGLFIGPFMVHIYKPQFLWHHISEFMIHLWLSLF